MHRNFAQNNHSSQCQCRWSAELLAKYKIGRKLGGGAYGCVHEGEVYTTGEPVAIKKIQNISASATDAKRLLREISLLRMFRGHPTLIGLKYIGTHDSQHFNEVDLVFERYQTDLAKIIYSSAPLTRDHIEYIFYQMLHGIYSLHATGLVHRDLKPANILINSDCTTKVCDFGLARAIKEAKSPQLPSPPPLLRQLTPYVITRWYRSPEVVLHRRAEAPADMWSLGCILAELLLRKPLFPANDERTLLNLIVNLIGTPKPEDIPNQVGNHLASQPQKPKNFQSKFAKVDANALDLLEKLLEFNPAKRITAEQALRHPFFSNTFAAQDLALVQMPSSAADQSSMQDYYQFEKELNSNAPLSNQVIIQKARTLILKEIARYAQEGSPTLVLQSKPIIPSLPVPSGGCSSTAATSSSAVNYSAAAPFIHEYSQPGHPIAAAAAASYQRAASHIPARAVTYEQTATAVLNSSMPAFDYSATSFSAARTTLESAAAAFAAISTPELDYLAPPDPAAMAAILKSAAATALPAISTPGLDYLAPDSLAAMAATQDSPAAAALPAISTPGLDYLAPAPLAAMATTMDSPAAAALPAISTPGLDYLAPDPLAAMATTMDSPAAALFPALTMSELDSLAAPASSIMTSAQATSSSSSGASFLFFSPREGNKEEQPISNCNKRQKLAK